MCCNGNSYSYSLPYTNDLTSKHSLKSQKNTVQQNAKITFKIPAASIQTLYNVLPLSVSGICEYNECHSFDEFILGGKKANGFLQI